MSRVILIDPCKDERWDRFVESHPFGWICHLSGWKRVLENSFPHMKGYYLALIDDNGEIKAGLPIYEVRSKLTGNRLVSIPFATLSDPLIRNEMELNILLDYVKRLALELDISYFELKTFQSDNNIRNNFLNRKCFFKNHYLLLNNKLDELVKLFHASCIRRVIFKTIKLPLEKKKVETLDELKEFYKLYSYTRKQLGLPPQPWNFFANIFKNFGPCKFVSYSLAILANKNVCGAIMLFDFKNRVSWESIGVSQFGKKIGVTHFLLWKSIEEAYYKNKEVFDFGRTNVNNVGLMIFKNRWGTKVADLPIYYFNNNNNHMIKLNEEKFIYNLTRKVCRCVPTPMLKVIGNLCYKHLG